MSAINPKFKIAICGGGIGGLALAAVLARHEREDSPIEVNLYEGRPEITTFGAGITVWQRTWRVMQLLGIDGQLAEASVRPPNKGIGPGFTYRRGDNDTNPFTYHTVMLPYGSSSMHRGDLVGVLKSNIPSRYKIHVSKKLSKYIEIADKDGQIKHIELTFTDGTTAEADILIGADGIKSAVRSTMYDLAHQHECSLDIGRDDCPRCSAATPKWTGMIAYRYLIPTERLKKVNPNHQGLRSTLCYSGKSKHVVSYPVSHGSFITFIGFITDPEAEGGTYDGKWVQTVPREELVALFAGWEREVQEMLECVVDSPSRWAIHMVPGLPFSVTKRVALIGDAVSTYDSGRRCRASHRGPPCTFTARAKADTAEQDAYILGRLLTHPLATPSRVPEVLRIYQSVRLPFAKTVLQRARATGRMCEFNGEGCYDGRACPDERERLEELGRALYRQWQWQWQWRFDDQWDVAEWAIEQSLHMDTAKLQAR